MYDWPLQIAGKTYLEQADIDDFNKAFKFAVEHFTALRPKGERGSWNNTLEEQQRIRERDFM